MCYYIPAHQTTVGMLSPCFSSMDCERFQELPNSTNSVESYNRFGKSTHPQPLKIAMMAAYREDMAKAMEIMAKLKGLSTNYDNQSESARSKRSGRQRQARRKRLCTENDDPEGPPDTKSTFNPGMQHDQVIIHVRFKSMNNCFMIVHLYTYTLYKNIYYTQWTQVPQTKKETFESERHKCNR